MKLDLTLPEILEEAESISRDVRSTFGRLTAEQINWKPSADRWSVAQCLDHLISANRKFFPVFDATANGTKRTTFVERLPFLPGLFGRLMIKVVAPGGKQKLKAPRAAAPATSALDPKIVDQFVAHQQEAIVKMKAIENFNPARIIITSPFAGAITYSLLDACRIIVVHERRHLAQAERVMATDGFPK